MKTLVESAERYLEEDFSEDEISKAKSMLAEGIALWHVKFDGHMKLVDALNVQGVIDKMADVVGFNTAKSVSFNRMSTDSL